MHAQLPMHGVKYRVLVYTHILLIYNFNEHNCYVRELK